MELEAINNKINYGYIYIIQIMNSIYIGSGEDANNKIDQRHLHMSYSIKLKRISTNKATM